MASAGRILIMPKGDYDANSTYDNLDLVKHNGLSWVAKKTVKGIEPSEENTEFWHKMFDLNIANNLTTEEEGYALDARQGKVLNDKIVVLDNKVSTVYTGSIDGDVKNTIIENWVNIPYGVSLCVLNQSTQCMALIGKTTEVYGSVFIIAYSFETPLFGKIVDGIWHWD